jgi:hypothetical protein
MTTKALEKGHTMKKIFALACATSALASVASANANAQGIGIGSKGDQFSVTIQGTVPGYCTLSSSGTFNISNGSYTPSGNRSGNFQITNLGSAGGVVQGVSATGSFQIAANESCNLSLVSANGGLVNQSNSAANKISYSAVVYDSGSPSALVPVPAAPNTPFSAFGSQFNPSTLGNETVNFGFSISSGTSPVAAGNYQDLLTLIVNPTI